jgi:hypothetical protein
VRCSLIFENGRGEQAQLLRLLTSAVLKNHRPINKNTDTDLSKYQCRRGA